MHREWNTKSNSMFTFNQFVARMSDYKLVSTSQLNDDLLCCVYLETILRDKVETFPFFIS